MATIQNQENISSYQEQIKKGVTDPLPYDRLMIYYRKEKEYKKELQVINRALEIFGKQLKRQQQEMFKGVKSTSTIKKLSAQISKFTGLADKKGNHSFIPGPIARWTKRKATVEQKIKK